MLKNILPAYAAAMLLSASAAMALPMYTITDLGDLGAVHTQPTDINNSGQVVGVAQTATGAYHAFLWDSVNGMIDLGTPNGINILQSYARSINNSGQVVGSFFNGVANVGFLWDNVNGMVPILNPDGRARVRIAYGINDSGQVVGESSTNGAVLWDITNGTVPIGDYSTYRVAFDINDNGQVVGRYDSEIGRQSFLWQDGVMTELGDLPGGFDTSEPTGINNNGQVVGRLRDQSDFSHVGAFIWDSVDGMVLLESLGGSYTSPSAINDSGQVVGFGVGEDNQNHALLWTENNGVVNVTNLSNLVLGIDNWHLIEASSINASGQIVGYGVHNNLYVRGFLLTPVDAGLQTEAIAPGVHPDREAILNPSSQSGSLNDIAEFSTDGQSMWASGDALFNLNWQRAFGPDEPIDETFASPDSLITASVFGGFKAQLETGLTISSGFLDMDYGYDVAVDYAFDPATGNLHITTGANNPRGNLNTTAPDIAFDLGLDFDITAGFAVDAHILGVPIPLGAANVHLGTGFSFSHGLLVGNADYCVIGTSEDCGFETPYGSLSLNQLSESPDISAQTNAAGLITGHVDTASIMAGNGGGDSQTDILSGTVDIDAILLARAGLPPESLGRAYHSDLGGYGSASFSYDLIDADLNIGLGLGQDVSFTPHLMAEISINGQTVTVPVGESFTVNVGTNARNIFLNANYILDNTFTNTVSVAGTLNANATFGAFSAEGDIPILGFPDLHFDVEEVLFEYETPSAHGNLFSVFDNTFRVTGFNSHTSNWNIDIPDNEAAPVSQFAGAPSSTGQLATDGTVDWQVDGTAFFEGGHIVAQTNSPTLIYTNLTLPVDVAALTFDFMAITTVSGDVLKLYFGDIELFSLTGEMFGADWMRTDFIDISAYAGLTDLLTIALLSPTGVHSEMLIDNIFFYDTMADIVGGVSSVPEPGTLFLLGAGLLGLISRRRKWAA